MDVTIEALGARGDGVATVGGERIYVAGALAGERVEIALEGHEGGVRRARLAKVIEPAPDRVAPPCPHFGTCGGCAAQHMGEGLYRRWKEGILADALARAGLEAQIAPMIAIGPGTRRRAALFARRLRDGVALGFFEAASHRIVDMSRCPALAPELFALTAPLRAFLGRVLPPGGAANVDAQLVGTAVDLVIAAPVALDLALRERLAEFAETNAIARLGWREVSTGGGRGHGRARPGAVDTVIARAPVAAIFGGVAVDLPPLAFLQASGAGEAALTRFIEDAVPDGAAVADLFAGAGTFSFALAAGKGGRRVRAFDGEADMIGALNGAARRAGLGARVEGAVRNLSRRPLGPDELSAFDAAVFDPPRAGAPAQARAFAASSLPLVVAVSCNPVSFARDARTLVDGGFKIGAVQPVDQFVWTRHLELAVAFRR